MVQDDNIRFYLSRQTKAKLSVFNLYHTKDHFGNTLDLSIEIYNGRLLFVFYTWFFSNTHLKGVSRRLSPEI